MSLSGGALRGMVAGLADLYAPVTDDDYPDRVIKVISGLFDTGSCSYNHLAGAHAIAYQVEPPEVIGFPDADQLFRQHLPEHPLLAYIDATGDASARRISDVASDRQFRALGLYSDFYRPAEVEYQLAVTVPAPQGGLIAIALNRRGRDFSDEERELLDLLGPHVGQSAGIAALLSQPLTATLRDRAGQPLLTPRQSRILQLVADGYQDRAIARALGISIRTVHTHLQHIYRQLGVTSRTEALARLRAPALAPGQPPPGGNSIEHLFDNLLRYCHGSVCSAGVAGQRASTGQRGFRADRGDLAARCGPARLPAVRGPATASGGACRHGRPSHGRLRRRRPPGLPHHPQRTGGPAAAGRDRRGPRRLPGRGKQAGGHGPRR